MLFNSVAPSIVKVVMKERQEGSTSRTIEGTGFVVQRSDGQQLVITANHVAFCNDTSQTISRLVFINRSDYFPSSLAGTLFAETINEPSKTRFSASVFDYHEKFDYCFLRLPAGVPFIPPLRPSVEVSRGKVSSYIL